ISSCRGTALRGSSGNRCCHRRTSRPSIPETSPPRRGRRRPEPPCSCWSPGRPNPRHLGRSIGLQPALCRQDGGGTFGDQKDNNASMTGPSLGTYWRTVRHLRGSQLGYLTLRRWLLRPNALAKPKAPVTLRQLV